MLCIIKTLGTRYWFHGTDHTSALNILKNGIDLARGKLGGDFSHGSGFYLTPDLEFAISWSNKLMKKETCAVIVFDTKSNTGLFPEGDGLVVPTPDEEWASIVKDYRNRVNEERKTRAWLTRERQRKYIYGVMSKDGNSAKAPNWRPLPRSKVYNNSENKTAKSFVMQLCIKDDFLALDFFDISEIFVIFFK